MDNLTHSLIGAALGQAGLKRKTGLAMPALIIGANLPDIDAGCVVYGIESLAMRRGITHGPIALVVLPLLLAGGLWWFDRWQQRRGKRPAGRAPVQFGWLLALCLIGTLSHPLFDWFNNYGIRLLEPFSSTWFYGDTLFIIDLWIWAMLGAGLWLSLRRERAGTSGWTGPARAAIAVVTLYIGFNLGLSAYAVDQMRAKLRLHPESEELIVANPVPFAFWQRQMLVKSGPFHGSAEFSLTNSQDEPTRGLRFPGAGTVNDGWSRDVFPDIDLDAERKRDKAVDAFLFWSRMPVVAKERDRIVLSDQRFAGSPVRSNFTVTLNPPE